KFTEHNYVWPTQEEEIHTFVDDEKYESDVYLNPVPLKSDSETATEDDVREVRTLWIDLDDEKVPNAEDEVKELGGFLVNSGTEDHYHAYFPLDAPIDPESAKILNTALKVKYGGDPKQSATSLLRVPFTLNLKPRNG